MYQYTSIMLVLQFPYFYTIYMYLEYRFHTFIPFTCIWIIKFYKTPEPVTFVYRLCDDSEYNKDIHYTTVSK